MPRLFIGSPLPAKFKQAIDQPLRSIETRLPAAVRWIPFGNLHLTWAFLGMVGDHRLNDIKRLLQTTERPTVQFKITHLDYDRRNRPRLIWLYLQDQSGQAARLTKTLVEQLSSIGLRPVNPDRRFSPHVTLARLKNFHQVNPPSIGRALSWSWAVGSINLYSSETLPEGAKYRLISSYPLNKNSGG